MTKQFVEDEHWNYFDDWYSSDNSMRLIYEAIDAESVDLLKKGHEEIQNSECYDNYGCPSYIR